MLRRGEKAPMLIGSFAHALDAKGRVFIPAKWRETLGDVLVVTQGLLADRDLTCLFGMSVGEWDQFSARLAQLPLTDMAGQAVRRRLYATASACEIDRQGRILLPAQLRELSAIQKDVTLIGIGNRIELWEPGQLARHSAAMESDFEAALQHLSQVGI